MDNNKKAVLEALENCHGIVSSACKSVDMPRSTYYLWYNSDEEFKAAVDEIQEVAIDFVESKLMEKVNGVTCMGKDDVYELAPSDTAIIFYLKTKGKKRGYVERMEIDNLNPMPVLNVDPLSDATGNDSITQD